MSSKKRPVIKEDALVEPPVRTQIKALQRECLGRFDDPAYGQAISQYGLVGALVRIEDQIKQSVRLTQGGVVADKAALRQTLVDLSNYALLAISWVEKGNVLPLPVGSLDHMSIQDDVSLIEPADGTVASSGEEEQRCHLM